MANGQSRAAGPSGPVSLFAADCGRCAALCCLALTLDRGERFAIDKPAGAPCPNLRGHDCRLHDRLTVEGFSGCAAYDCTGAGQRVVQEVFGGASWQDDPALAAPMIAAFALMRQVQQAHQLLAAAAALPLTPAQEATRTALLTELAPEARGSAAGLDGFAASGLEGRIRSFLRNLAPHLAQGEASG